MSRPPDVFVAGGGVAGAAVALRLRALGLAVEILVRDTPPAPGLEAVPKSVVELFAVLDEPEVLDAAGAMATDGPVHVWHGAARRTPGTFRHVDRIELAARLLERAVARGATVTRVARLPPSGELASHAHAVVDATGRAAAWSRPVQHDSRRTAWQFVGPPDDDPTARVVGGDGWWAYRIGHAAATWAGVVTEGSLDAAGLHHALRRLGVDPLVMRPAGRRPAGVQRAVRPVDGRRVATGDAALAHDPVAGQGIRFAVGSALAAATTITNWDGTMHDTVASAYYADLVADERRRHLAALRSTAAGADIASEPDVPATLRFAGRIVDAALSVNGRIAPGPAIALAGGAITRWAGSFDLLELSRLAADPTPRLLLLVLLQNAGLSLGDARSLVTWAVAKGLLVDARDRSDQSAQ